MNKLVLLVKRKPGLTHEEFRKHYIASHAPLARAKLPHLRKYVRNFLVATPGQPDPEYDCVTEFWFDDRAGLDASVEWTRSPEGQILAEDEERFMDRASMKCYFAEEHEN